jgi:ribosome-binding factor A
MRKHSVKNTRVNGEVQKVLAEIIRGEIKDPRISPWTSVVAVEVAPDLKTCKAWISVLGDSEAASATLQGLKSAEGFIRRQLARTLNLRNTPVITFVLDQSIEYGVNMSHKIAQVMAKDNAAAEEFEEAADLETILNTGDILSRERGIDDLMWEKIDSLTTFNYFDIDAILGFITKLNIVARWYKLDEQTGREMFKKLVDEVRGTFKGVEYNG